MTAFGSILKELRQQNRLSQMALALNAEVSTRHISFMENGRSKPSREMVLHLSNVMDVPSRDVNLLLTSAGYSQEYSQHNLSDASMKDVREALTYMLDAHAPYPAVVIDSHWNLLMVNQAQMALTYYFTQHGAEFPETDNVMELFFHPKGYRLFITNWEYVGIFLLRRLYHEHLAGAHCEQENTLLNKILVMPDIPEDWKTRAIDFGTAPMVKVNFSINDKSFSLFSTISSFGTALDVTLQNIRLEHYLPGDNATRLFLEDLSATSLG